MMATSTPCLQGTRGLFLGPGIGHVAQSCRHELQAVCRAGPQRCSSSPARGLTPSRCVPWCTLHKVHGIQEQVFLPYELHWLQSIAFSCSQIQGLSELRCAMLMLFLSAFRPDYLVHPADLGVAGRHCGGRCLLDLTSDIEGDE
jgi:hypothetical protein